MGYKVVADRYEMDQMRQKYGPRKGLEGPFNFSGRVLYYDNLEQDEMNLINSQLVEKLKS